MIKSKRILLIFISLTIGLSKLNSQVLIEQLNGDSTFESNSGLGQIFTVDNELILKSITIYSNDNISRSEYFKLIQGPNSDIISEKDLVTINPNPNSTTINFDEEIILLPNIEYAFVFCINQDCSISSLHTFKAGCSYPNGELYTNGYIINSIGPEEFDSNASFSHCDLKFVIQLEESSTLSSDDFITGNHMNVYPNPNSGIFELPNKVKNINIITLTGQVIKIKKNGDSFDISHLNNGIYFVNFRFNNIIITQKVIKI